MHIKDHILTIKPAEGQPIKILFVMATDAEYGDALKSIGIKPVIVGVGPIRSAIKTTQILYDLKYLDCLPDLVINLGSGGSDALEQGAIFQASSVSYRDMDASPFGFPKGTTPFSNLPDILPISARVPGVSAEAVSTGAGVVSNGTAKSDHNEYNDFDEPIAEMEAYAIYNACLGFGIPIIKLMGISDGHKALEGMQKDWSELLPEIDKKLAQAILDLKSALEEGSISRESLLTLPEPLRAARSVYQAIISPTLS